LTFVSDGCLVLCTFQSFNLHSGGYPDEDTSQNGQTLLLMEYLRSVGSKNFFPLVGIVTVTSSLTVSVPNGIVLRNSTKTTEIQVAPAVLKKYPDISHYGEP